MFFQPQKTETDRKHLISDQLWALMYPKMGDSLIQGKWE